MPTNDSKIDHELESLLGDVRDRQSAGNADGMSFIDWHSSAADLICQRYNRALANAFNKTRQDTGTLGERFKHGVETLKHVLTNGELPKPKTDKHPIPPHAPAPV